MEMLLRVDGSAVSPRLVADLGAVLGEHPGNVPVVLDIDTRHGVRRLRFGSRFNVEPSPEMETVLRRLGVVGH